MLGTRYKHLLDRLLNPLASALSRWGISPNALTVAGLALSSSVCLWFWRTRAVVPFCFAITATCLLDALDGAVARVSGRVSRFGAYLDAVCDRYVEAVVILTTASVTGYWTLSVIVLAGSMLVSYAKARAAMEVAVSNTEWPDLMERGERDVIFVVGLLLSASVPWAPLGRDLFWWTLVLLAVLIHLTVIQRIMRARTFMLTRP